MEERGGRGGEGGLDREEGFGGEEVCLGGVSSIVWWCFDLLLWGVTGWDGAPFSKSNVQCIGMSMVELMASRLFGPDG